MINTVVASRQLLCILWEDDECMLLYSKPFIDNEIEELVNRVAKLDNQPTLSIVQVGDNPASNAYIRNKVKLCEQVGIKVLHDKLPEDITEEYLLRIISVINNSSVDGCIVQLPLPKHINEHKVINALCPYKDVDGLTDYNKGLFYTNHKYSITPCTARGIMELLDYYNVEFDGKDVVVLNRSEVVGKPLAKLLLDRNATVTTLHSRSKHQDYYVTYADIVITAVGIPYYLGSESFLPPCTVVDVSMNTDPMNGKLCGDVTKDDYDELVGKGVSIVPVPKGVGPVTCLMLAKNLLDLIEYNEAREL